MHCWNNWLFTLHHWFAQFLTFSDFFIKRVMKLQFFVTYQPLLHHQKKICLPFTSTRTAPTQRISIYSSLYFSHCWTTWEKGWWHNTIASHNLLHILIETLNHFTYNRLFQINTNTIYWQFGIHTTTPIKIVSMYQAPHCKLSHCSCYQTSTKTARGIIPIV